MSEVAFSLPEDVMNEARAAAREDGAPVDQFLTALIAEGLVHRRGSAMMRARAGRGDPQAALALLRSLPSLPTEPHDELPDDAAQTDRRNP